jgi:hydroxyacylglutathione hydrolase
MKVYKLVFSPIQVNTYVVADISGDCAIIDCGCYDRNEFSGLVDLLEANRLKPVLLLNTHCHLDHIFGNNFVLDKYGLRPYSSQLEEPIRINAAKHASLFGLSMDNPPEPAGFIEDKEKLMFGDIELQALHVPGHTPGSLAFYFKEENCVFTGDALFAGSIGRTDRPGGSFETLIISIKTQLLSLPADTVVYSGHGRDTTIGKELTTNKFLV